ncbi:MAG: type II secretion system F family protein [Armatimonadota bacterium]
MKNYTYSAKDKNGNTIKGNIDAEDERSAALSIRQSGLWPITIVVTKNSKQQSLQYAGSPIERYLIHPLYKGVSIVSLALFFRSMATFASSGMSVSESLRHLGQRTKGKLGKIIRDAQKRVETGGKFSDELSRHPYIFNMMILSLVKAGESFGKMDVMLDKIASALEYEISIRRLISKVSFYPIIVFLMIIIIPHIPNLFLEGGVSFINSLWASVRLWLPYVFIVFIILKLLFQFDSVRYLWDLIKINIPFFGKVAHKLALSRFSKIMAITYNAGLNMSDCVKISGESSGNMAINKALKKAIVSLQSGRGVVESLTRTKVLNPMVMDMLATGEKTGVYDNVLNTAAEHMESECDNAIQAMSVMLFVSLILIAGFFVIRIVINFYTQYYQYIGQ